MAEIFRLMQAQQEQQQRWMQAQQEEEQWHREEHQCRWEEQHGQEEQRQMVQLQMEVVRSMLGRISTMGSGVSTGRARLRDPVEHIKLTR